MNVRMVDVIIILYAQVYRSIRDWAYSSHIIMSSNYIGFHVTSYVTSVVVYSVGNSVKVYVWCRMTVVYRTRRLLIRVALSRPVVSSIVWYVIIAVESWWASHISQGI